MPNEDKRYTICCDFDGVIHRYESPWRGAEFIDDEPVPGAIHWLNKIVRRFNVVIFTTRGSSHAGREAVRAWLIEHGFDPVKPISVTAEKPPALIYIDDRGYRFTGDNFPTAEEIHQLRPWNKGA